MSLSQLLSRAFVGLAVSALMAAAPSQAATGSDANRPGEVLVKLRSTQALGTLLNRYPLTLVSQFGARPIYRLKVVGNIDLRKVLGELAFDPDVFIAETNPESRSPEARKNMPWVVGEETAYMAQWAPQALRLAQAQAISRGDGVRVAVLDTGVDLNHPALAGHLLPGFDFVDFDNDPSEVGSSLNAGFGHGTHVAGLIRLVAPGANIMPVRVLDAEGVGNAWVLAEAMLYAINPDGNPATDDGAHVINLSLGSLARTRILAAIAQIASCGLAVTGDPISDRSDPGYADDEARCQNTPGALIVAAAGNDASDAVKEYPAAESAYGLVPVGASTVERRMARFSNTGSWIDIAAPGEGITSTIPGGGWATWSGTSMAAPLVAGVGALLQSSVSGITPKEMARRIKRTGSALCGTAILNVDALAALTDTRSGSSNCRIR